MVGNETKRALALTVPCISVNHGPRPMKQFDPVASDPRLFASHPTASTPPGRSDGSHAIQPSGPWCDASMLHRRTRPDDSRTCTSPPTSPTASIVPQGLKARETIGRSNDAAAKAEASCREKHKRHRW